MPEANEIDTEQSGISWTERTWNPWMGCTKVSPGCAHCYMFRDQARYGNDPTKVRRSKTKFGYPLKLEGSHLIFTCSWSDWFHEAADEWRDEAWDIVRACPQHTFQILTKRPELIADRLPADWGDGWPNVWLGVSIENARHTYRADVLRGIPAALRFISAEPLLGSLYPSDAGRAVTDIDDGARLPDGGPDRDVSVTEFAGRAPAALRAPLNLDGIDWVIAGGESGSRADARPAHPQWVRELRDAVLAVSIDDDPPDASRLRPAFHFKQWGSWTPDPYGRDRDGVYLAPDGSTRSPLRADATGDLPDGSTRVRYAGPLPTAGGKFLDGTDWCEIPERTTPEPPGQLTLA